MAEFDMCRIVSIWFSFPRRQQYYAPASQNVLHARRRDGGKPGRAPYPLFAIRYTLSRIRIPRRQRVLQRGVVAVDVLEEVDAALVVDRRGRVDDHHRDRAAQ